MSSKILIDDNIRESTKRGNFQWRRLTTMCLELFGLNPILPWAIQLLSRIYLWVIRPLVKSIIELSATHQKVSLSPLNGSAPGPLDSPDDVELFRCKLASIMVARVGRCSPLIFVTPELGIWQTGVVAPMANTGLNMNTRDTMSMRTTVPGCTRPCPQSWDEV